MKLFFDTSVLVDVDRRRPATLDLLRRLTAGEDELWISTVTVSEILTGAYLRRDHDKAVVRAKEVLAQFQWKELDGGTAETTAQLVAYLRAAGLPIEFQDVVIAASALAVHADALLTENPDHFRRFPPLKEATHTADEFAEREG